MRFALSILTLLALVPAARAQDVLGGTDHVVAEMQAGAARLRGQIIQDQDAIGVIAIRLHTACAALALHNEATAGCPPLPPPVPKPVDPPAMTPTPLETH